jgi:hypothetical protein
LNFSRKKKSRCIHLKINLFEYSRPKHKARTGQKGPNGQHPSSQGDIDPNPISKG